MKRCLLLALLFPYFCDAQIKVTEAGKKLADIEKLLFVKPDSARVLIRQITNGREKQPDTIYAMANIYHGYYHLLKNNLDSSIYYYDRALGYAPNSPSHRGRALRLMAAPYRKKTNYDKSLQLLVRAEKEYSAIDDTRGLATVYGEMGANYNAMLRPQDAIPYLVKAIALFEKAKNKKDQLPIKQSLANTYLNIGNYEFAADLYAKTLQGFKQAGMLKNYYLTLINYSECLINTNRHELAKRSLMEAIAGLEQFNDTELIGSAYATLGRLEIQNRNFVQANVYQEKAFKLLSSVNSSRTVGLAVTYLKSLVFLKKMDKALEVIALVDNSTYKSKANLQELSRYEKIKVEVYNKVEKPGLALASAKSAIELLDTLNQTQDKKAVIAMQAGIQREHQDKKSDTLQQINSQLRESVESTERKKWIWISLPLLLLAALAARLYYKNARHRKKVAASQSAIRELATEQISARVLNEKMTGEIEQQQKQLSAIEHKTANIERYLDNVASLESGTGHVTDLKSLIGEDDHGAHFRETFSHSNAAFMESLAKEYPQLSESDLYFCSLLNLNLPYKDLSVILKVVPEAVRKRKYRIRKKMGINEEKQLERILAAHGKTSKV